MSSQLLVYLIINVDIVSGVDEEKSEVDVEW